MPDDPLPQVLLAEAAAVGIFLTPEQGDQLLRYLTLLARWRTRARLTTVAEVGDAARVHVADSLLCLRAGLGTYATLLDVGSGGGLPGIPLKVVRPDLDVTLLEAGSRKAAFLELAAQELGLHLRIVCLRAEDAARDPELRERFDVATARALAPLAVACELTLPFVRPGGQAVLLKGPSVHGELQAGRGAALALGGGEPKAIDAALAGGERRVVVVIPKTRQTPIDFPRRAGVPRVRPIAPIQARRMSRRKR